MPDIAIKIGDRNEVVLLNEYNNEFSIISAYEGNDGNNYSPQIRTRATKCCSLILGGYMSKKVFKGWCSRLAKANEFLAHQADLIDRPDFGWGFYLKKSDCDFSHDHMPPKRITITVEVEDT